MKPKKLALPKSWAVKAHELFGLSPAAQAEFFNIYFDQFFSLDDRAIGKRIADISEHLLPETLAGLQMLFEEDE